MATSFSGGGSRNTRREPSTMGKQLVNFITCGWESSAPFLVIDKAGARTHTVLVIGLYELFDPTTYLIEPPGPLLAWNNYIVCSSGQINKLEKIN
jgi:hypothetical protein